MKFSSLQENLKRAVSIVSHIAGKNQNLPILNNIKIEVKNGNISFVATDLEIGIVHKIRGKIEKEGSYTVDAKLIYDYISLLPVNKKIKIEKDNSFLKIENESYKTKIKGIEAEEYPLIPEFKNSLSWIVNTKDLRQSLSQVVFAVSNSDTRIELTGVLFAFKDNSLTLVATDSHRLTEKTIKAKEQNKNKKMEIGNVIVPARTLQELLRILSNLNEGEGQEIEVHINDNQIMFIINQTELVSRLIEGQFPDYKQIIPTNYKTKAITSRNELIRAVKASSLFSQDKICDISLDFPKNQNKILVSAVSAQKGESIAEVEAILSGNDNGVAINYRYLLDGLNNIDAENVIIEIIDGNTPCLIKPEKDDNYIYIVMPIKQ